MGFFGERFAGMIVGEYCDFLLLAAIAKDEIDGREVCDVVALFVVDHNIDQDEVGGRAHGGYCCRRFRRGCLLRGYC